jgi:hypothetical protein
METLGNRIAPRAVSLCKLTGMPAGKSAAAPHAKETGPAIDEQNGRQTTT